MNLVRLEYYEVKVKDILCNKFVQVLLVLLIILFFCSIITYQVVHDDISFYIMISLGSLFGFVSGLLLFSMLILSCCCLYSSIVN